MNSKPQTSGAQLPNAQRFGPRPHVLHIITGLNDGGAEAVLFGLVGAASSFEHTVISLTGPGKYGPMLQAAGITVMCLGIRSAFHAPLKLSKLTAQVRKTAPDLVQTWMYHGDLLGGVAARRAQVPVVWGLHHSTVDRQTTKWTTRQVARINARVGAWLPARIISCSQSGAACHQRLGYPAHKLCVVHNGYNIAAFQPNRQARAAIRAAFGAGNGTLLLGCVARYHPQKDHHTLLLALAAVAKARGDARLLLVGPGMSADNTALVGLIDALGLADRVSLAGARADIPAVMNGLDLHVLASAGGEACPNVLCEAMACGTPCVASDVGDSASILGKTGRIVAPRNPEALARAILDIAPSLKDPMLAATCRARILNHFTLDHMVAGYTSVWRACLPGAQRRLPTVLGLAA